MSGSLSQSPATASNSRTLLLAILAFTICSATAAICSHGFLESDGATHYLYARHAFAEPYRFVDVWGRPLYTALFALPATLGGLLAVRLTSLALAIACALIAYQLAKGQRYRWPALALIFTLGQPLLFLHSFSELTELPFALVIGAALLAYHRRQWAIMAALISLAPLGRPEGFGFLILAAIVLIAHRRPQWLLILPIGIIAWSIAGHLLDGPRQSPWWKWLIQNWAWDLKSSYPTGSPLHFLEMLPMLVGPFAFPAMWIGMGLGLGRDWRAPFGDHRRRIQWLIAAIPLGLLIAHSVFYWLGKFSSDGELRYLLVAAPLWGLLSAAGWEWVFQKMNWPGAIRWAALAVVAPGCVNFAWRVLPLEPSSSWLEAQRVAEWYQHSGVRSKYPRILCNHPGLYFYLDISPSDRSRVVPWSNEDASHAGNGVLFLWDPEFCDHNASQQYIVTLPQAISDGWVNDWKAEMLSNANNPPPWANYKILNPPIEPKDKSLPNTSMLWHIFKSPRDITGAPTPAITRTRDGIRWLETPGNPQSR